MMYCPSTIIRLYISHGRGRQFPLTIPDTNSIAHYPFWVRIELPRSSPYPCGYIQSCPVLPLILSGTYITV